MDDCFGFHACCSFLLQQSPLEHFLFRCLTNRFSVANAVYCEYIKDEMILTPFLQTRTDAAPFTSMILHNLPKQSFGTQEVHFYVLHKRKL